MWGGREGDIFAERGAGIDLLNAGGVVVYGVLGVQVGAAGGASVVDECPALEAENWFTSSTD